MIVVDAVNDIVVKFVQSLQQVEFLLNLVKLWLLRVRQTKEILTNSVGAVFPPQSIKMILEHLKSV